MNLFSKTRKDKKMTQLDVANYLGISRQAYSNYELGNRDPDKTTLVKLADLWQVTTDYLLGRDTAPRFDPSQNWIPVLGNVAAGVPMEAIESFDSDDPDDWEQLDDNMARNGKHIALRINGDSMEPKMSKGDVVIVRLQPDVESGETAIVRVNGDEATCKKIKKTERGLTLISTNTYYEPMFFTWEEVMELPVVILGKVVELRAKF